MTAVCSSAITGKYLSLLKISDTISLHTSNTCTSQSELHQWCNG